MNDYVYRGDPWLVKVNAQIMKARSDNGTVEAGQRSRNPGHGTIERARQHRRDGGKPCSACFHAEKRHRKAAAP